jgi:hypothetical protein
LPNLDNLNLNAGDINFDDFKDIKKVAQEIEKGANLLNDLSKSDPFKNVKFDQVAKDLFKIF